ncbi:MAG: class B sortase [Oscillospiraceae bacterium]
MNTKQKILICGAALCAALFLFSGFMVCRQYLDEKQSTTAFESVAELVKPAPESTDTPDEAAELQLTAYEKYADIYAANSDFVGWITIDGTVIDYPVMQTKDNPNFYLKHSFEKSYSDYGVPYVQEDCAIDLSDNTVIYGHHMKNGTMFSDLCKFESKDFYIGHKTVRFDTLDGYGEYEIIAVFKTVAYSEQGFKYYHFVDAHSKAEYDEFISTCKELALYDTGVTAEYGDKLITLSTCEYSQTNGRLVVVTRKITE